MKQLLLLFVGILIAALSFAQVGINTDGSLPDASAMLDVKSTTKGALFPRMTTAQRNAIATPATGLLVFDTDVNNFLYYNGSAWATIAQDGLWETSGSNVYLHDNTLNVGIGTNTPSGKLMVKADANHVSTNPIFNVRNKNGQRIFAVFDGWVEIYVNDNATGKTGEKGGLEVAGYDNTKGITHKYFSVSDDSIRFYIADGSVKTGEKGGLEVAGYDNTKAAGRSYLRVTTDSTVISFDQSAAKTGEKGGLEVAAYDNTKATGNIELLRVTPDSTSIKELAVQKAFILPTVVYTQLDTFPAYAGAMVFNTQDNSLQCHDGAVWSNCNGTSCAPATPGTITGNTSVAQNTTGVVYSIATVNRATSYYWTVPAEATIVSGQGTITITVNFGTAAGNVSVRAQNACGNSTYSNLAICIPLSQPVSVSGSTLPALSSTGNIYSIAAVPGATSYNWTVPSGSTITAGQGTTSITVTFGTTNGNVSVRAENFCNNSAYTNLAVCLTPVQPASVSGSASPVAASTGNTYSITAVSGATSYNWTVPSGATITAGQGTTSITVTMGSTAGNVSVRAQNACGNSTYIDLAVCPVPAAPGSITGNATPLSNATGVTYSISAVTGATSYNWTVPSDATITAGQGTTSITITFGTNDGNVSVRAENTCGNSAYTNKAVNVTLQLGDSYAGGIIFYIDGTGEHGYACASSDQSTSIVWATGNGNTGATATATGTGSSNTTTIVTDRGAGTYAAKLCNDLVLNTYSDWFLPSKDELGLMYTNLKAQGKGGFSNVNYWSSSESASTSAYSQSFSTGTATTTNKGTAYYVRAARAF